MDLTKVNVDANGMVQTGAGTSVNKDFLSAGGYQQALTYRNSGAAAPVLATQTTPAASIVRSSSSVVQGENKTKSDVQSALDAIKPVDDGTGALRTASDKYIGYLDSQNSQLEQRRASEAAALNAQFDALRKSTEKEQEKEVGTTTSTLARIGGYLGNSASATGALVNLNVSHKNEIMSLEAKRSAAIQAANNAINDKQFELAKMKYQEAKQIEKDVQERKEAFFTQNMQLVEANRKANETAFNKSKDYSELLAPVVSNMLTGDDATDVELLKRAAGEYGLDPNILAAKVQGYRTEQNLNKVKEYTSDIKNYQYAKGQGFKGTLQDWIQTQTQLRSSAGANQQIGVQLGLPPEDPIYFAVVGVNSPTIQQAYIKRYADMKNAGQTEAADNFVNKLIYQGLPAAQKGQFNDYTNALRSGNQALKALDTFSTSEFGLYKTAVEELKPFATLEKDQKWVDVIAKIGLAQSQIRRAFFGTAVTDTEKGTANSFLIDPERDDIETAKTKLSNLVDYVNASKATVFDVGLGNVGSETFNTGGQAGSVQQVNIMGTNYNVGDIVSNSATGARGRVEANGTITPIQ